MLASIFHSLLEFSFSTLVSDALDVIGSIITFITGNSFIIMLIGIPLVLGILFALINHFRR